MAVGAALGVASNMSSVLVGCRSDEGCNTGRAEGVEAEHTVLAGLLLQRFVMHTFRLTYVVGALSMAAATELSTMVYIAVKPSEQNDTQLAAGKEYALKSYAIIPIPPETPPVPVPVPVPVGEFANLRPAPHITPLQHNLSGNNVYGSLMATKGAIW